jgi:hypothetical protein
LLSGSGTAIYFMRLRADNLKGKYPPTTCKTIIGELGKNMEVW